MGITYLSPSSSSPMPPPSKRTLFSIGDDVEVVAKAQASYYEATVICCLQNGPYVVLYKTILNDDDNYAFFTETVYPEGLRPLPPHVVVSPAGFSLNQTVDAFENQGWWVTAITAKTGPDYYVVYSKTTDRDLELHCSQLRVHQEWINGQWVLL